MNKQPDSTSRDLMLAIYRHIMDEIDVGVHVVDANGKTIVYNKKMMQIEEMDREDVLYRNLLDVFRFSKEGDSTLLQALKSGKVTKNAKQTYFNNKGQEITTVNNTHPIVEDGRIIGAVEIANDVTKLERLIRENMEHKGNTRYTFDSIIGKSEAIRSVVDIAKRATRTTSSVLIVGETGSGKELFAQSIHNGSPRSSAPFISQNCAALPDTLVEGLLFGTKRGAFTGATERPGLFEQAEGGTLLLDEINALHPNLQAKLLRALQEKTVRRIGDTKDRPFDVRIIATMNEDPIEAINHNRLRKDLYYRLSVVTLFVPPLRERKEDIPLLVQRFIEKYNAMFQMRVKGVSEDVMHMFQSYNWPGNVRELEHVVEGAMNLIVDEDTITSFHLPTRFSNRTRLEHVSPEFLNSDGNIKTFKEQMEAAEKNVIKKALKAHNGNVTKTADALGISRQSLQYRMKKLNIHNGRHS